LAQENLIEKKKKKKKKHIIPQTAERNGRQMSRGHDESVLDGKQCGQFQCAMDTCVEAPLFYTANSVKRSSQIRRSAMAQMIPDVEPVAFPCSNCLNDRMEN
jgi:hypothetical protein